MNEVTTRENSVSNALVFKWHCRFSDGQDSLEEQEGRGRKKKKTYGATIVTSIHVVLVLDRRLTIMVQRFDMGYGTIHRILTELLQMLKIILSKKLYLYGRTCCKWCHIIGNLYKQVCVLKYGQLLTELS